MSKSIIIGSNGYLGRNLVYYLSTQNEEIICYDIHKASIASQSNYNQLDITNYESVSKIDVNTDYIYMFAGITGTYQGFDEFNRYIDINEKGLLNILTRIRDTGSQARIIFPSTRLVYKGQTGVLLKEDSEKETKTLYALNKLACENLLLMYENAFGLKYTIFRICVPYGTLIEGETSYGTIGFFLNKAMNGQNIPLYGDGSLRRTFTHVADICRILYETVKIKKSEGKIYNIGGENLSLLDLASKIANKYRVKVEFVLWPDLTIKIESGDTIFDSSLLDTMIKEDYKYRINEWLGE
jgi:UDP-glucose 4-epimerase